MNEMLILTAVVIVICIILNKISNRLGIPMLLGFIVLGMVFGSDGILKIQLTILLLLTIFAPQHLYL